ncbi:MAG: type II secretion system protein GspM [Acidiferrobacterales bacterium]
MMGLWFEELRNYWRSLQRRERLMIAGGGALALVMSGYALLWAPLQRDLSRLHRMVPAERVQLLTMRVQAREISRLRAGGPAAGGTDNLLTTLERSAQEHGLREYITRMEPDAGSGVRVSLDAVAFNTLLEWLADLQRQAGVRAQTATITAQAGAGVVNARLLLHPAGT